MADSGTDLLRFTDQGLSPGSSIPIPQGKLSESDIAGPYEALSRGLDKLGGGLEAVSQGIDKMAVPLAEKQAAEDLNKQKVTLDANGHVQILNPANSTLMYGQAGEAYRRAINVGTLADSENVMRQAFTEAHTKNPLDAASFKANTDAMLEDLQGRYGGTIVGQNMLRAGRSLQTEHIDHITNAEMTNNVANQRTAMESNISALNDKLIGLARQNGTDSLEFTKTWNEYLDKQTALADNPLFKRPKELINNEITQTYAMMRGESVVEQTDRTYNTKGKAEAQKILDEQIWKNPDLSEKDRHLLYSQGMSHLDRVSGDARAASQADMESVAALKKGMLDGTVKPGDPHISQMREEFTKNNSTDALAQLDAITRVFVPVQNAMSRPDNEPSIRARETGGGPAGQVIYNKLLQRGYTPVLAAAITGNMKQESEFNPAAPNPKEGGIGLLQWRLDRRAALEQFAASRGKSPTDLDTQLDFIGYELSHGEARHADRLFSAATLSEANSALHNYIRYGDESEHARLQYASMAAGGNFSALKGRIATLGGGGSGAGAGGWTVRTDFSQAEYNANPRLMTEVLRAIANDPVDKSAALSQIVSTARETVKGGNTVGQDYYDELAQAGQRDPAKYGFLADEMKGIQQAQQTMGGGGVPALSEPERQREEQAIQQRIGGADIHEQRMMNTWLDMMRAQDEAAKTAPLATYANRFGMPAPPPLDPAAPPEAIGNNMQVRAGMAEHIGQLNHSMPPPLLDKGADENGLRTALLGKNGPAVLQQLTNMRPADMAGLTDNEGFRNDLLGMAHSADPTGQQQQAAFNFMERWAGANWKDFDVKMKEEGKLDLRWYQTAGRYLTGDQIHDRLANQPPTLDTASKKAVEKYLEGQTSANIAANFKPTFWDSFTSIHPTVVAPPGAPEESQMLKSDHDALFGEAYRRLGSLDQAEKYVTDEMSKIWAPSQVNGNRLTRYAPEQWYRARNGTQLTVGGSMNWMKEQATQDFQHALGLTPSDINRVSMQPLTEQTQAALAKYAAGFTLRSDNTTAQEAMSGRPPSYRIQVQGKYGPEDLVDAGGKPQRMRFDPTPFIQGYADRTLLGARAAQIPPPPTQNEVGIGVPEPGGSQVIIPRQFPIGSGGGVHIIDASKPRTQ